MISFYDIGVLTSYEGKFGFLQRFLYLEVWSMLSANVITWSERQVFKHINIFH